MARLYVFQAAPLRRPNLLCRLPHRRLPKAGSTLYLREFETVLISTGRHTDTAPSRSSRPMGNQSPASIQHANAHNKRTSCHPRTMTTRQLEYSVAQAHRPAGKISSNIRAPRSSSSTCRLPLVNKTTEVVSGEAPIRRYAINTRIYQW